MTLRKYLRRVSTLRTVRVKGHVVPDSIRCVQCGICSFNCPIDIDVRRHAWNGMPIKEQYCLTCGECVKRCPRGVLHFESTNIFDQSKLKLKKV